MSSANGIGRSPRRLAGRAASHAAAAKSAAILFIAVRILLTGWAVVALRVNPLPEEPDEGVRPYLGEPALREGAAGFLLGPWQRFDTQHYMRIARDGYASEQDSVFPPLYPFAVRGLSALFGGDAAGRLLAGLLLSNLAGLGLLILLHQMASAVLGPGAAARTVLYIALFPTGFFLFAPYSEPIFILLAAGSFWAARKGRFWLAGGLGLLAALTRLTGVVLVVPLLFEYWRQARETGQSIRAWLLSGAASLLPVAGTAAFLLWRRWAGLPPLQTVYEQHWFQTTGLPGSDLITAVHSLFFGGAARTGEFTLAFDFACALFLIVSTVLVFRRFGVAFGLYNLTMLLFMFLPVSELKPLYSFSRYTLAFFPTFMLLGAAGGRPWVHRLILYPSLALFLYFSGQFFAWGWVA